MKKQMITMFCILLCGLVFLAVGALIAAEAPDVPDEVTIMNEGYKKDKKGSVKLSHKKHSADYGAKCMDCHHDYKDGKNVWVEGQPVKKCSSCHDPEKKQGNADKLQNSFHKNCKDCHKEVTKAGKKAPFKKCNDCHEKKS